MVSFLSTPSARRATFQSLKVAVINYISIHALREEGDTTQTGVSTRVLISIHALREEGDVLQQLGIHPES